MLVLSGDDIKTIIHNFGIDNVMACIIDRLTNGLARAYDDVTDLSPARDGFERARPVPGIIEWMPHRDDGDSTTIKTVVQDCFTGQLLVPIQPKMLRLRACQSGTDRR